MPKRIIKQPDYYSQFKCIGSSCEDTCCKGWTIEVDKDTYLKYQHCDHPGLKTQLQEYVEINPDSNAVTNYSRIKLKNLTCPFLDSSNLCRIQQEIGEDYLSRVCYTYPRVKNKVDEFIERTIYVSCPEAARLILLSPTQTQWHIINDDSSLDAVKDNAGSSIPSSQNCHNQEIRQFVMRLVQNRTYTIWERLTLLGLFCERLEKFYIEGSHSLLAYLNNLDENIVSHQYDSVIKAVIHRPMYQLDFALKMIHKRMVQGIFNQRFLDCISEFKVGLGINEAATGDEIGGIYKSVYDDYFLPFYNRYDYIFENYLVNYCIYTLFPFGRQKNIHYVPKSFFEEYIILASFYSLIRTMMAGMAGYYKGDLSTEHIIKLIQSFARVIEHDIMFSKAILKFLEDNNLNTMQFMALLVRT